MTLTPFSGAAEAARALRNGEISAAELLEALLARIERYNAELNALVTIDAESARQRAREADEALARGEVWGPLHGLPVTVKDVFETRGMRSTAGHLPLTNHIPQQDAAAVARLRAAGAIILGKTNLPPIASDVQTDNKIFGRTNNPWDLSRTPGGSTGGGAAAISAGLSYLELGSDLAGSVRIPAHYCGVCGFIPTDGRVPRDGHLPRQAPGTSVGRLLRVGLLARTVADFQLALPLIAGPLASEPDVVPVDLSWPRLEPAKLRLAWSDEMDATPISASVRDAVRGFVGKLAQSGCQVERVTPSFFDFKLARRVHNRIFMGALAAQLPAIPRLMGRFLGKMQAFDLSLPRYLEAEANRAALSAAVEIFLSGYDAWICPVSTTPAFPHHAPSGFFGPTPTYNNPILVDGQPVKYFTATTGFTVPFNVTGHPVVVIPAGQSPEGLPIGVQIIGRRWMDAALLEVAAYLQQAAGFSRRPPGYDEATRYP